MTMNSGASSALPQGSRATHAEDRPGTGGEHQPPEEREQARALAVRVHAPLEHGPEVRRRDGQEARIEEDVPGEDRLEVVVRHRHDLPVRPSEVEHEHRQAAGQQRDREQAGEAGERLVEFAAEHRCDRGHVERARGGDDEKNREYVRHAPHDAVAHAGDVMAVVLHEPGRTDPRQDQHAERAEQRQVGAAAAFDLAVLDACHA
jgi:hypothetical protein